ncbi:ion channel [Chloroflexota bacterium]
MNLRHVGWGPKFILGDELAKRFIDAAEAYLALKNWHTQAGLYDIAGQFYYREVEAKRKSWNWRKDYWPKLLAWVFRVLCGYGERPFRVVLSAMVIIFGLAGIYTALGNFASDSFLGYLYYSVVSFTALGYGSWIQQEPQSWAKGVGAAESAIGVFMMALFLITFTRKMAR